MLIIGIIIPYFLLFGLPVLRIVVYILHYICTLLIPDAEESFYFSIFNIPLFKIKISEKRQRFEDILALFSFIK